MAPLTGAYGWYTLALVLFLTTFGPLGGLWLIFYLAMSLIGFDSNVFILHSISVFCLCSAGKFQIFSVNSNDSQIKIYIVAKRSV